MPTGVYKRTGHGPMFGKKHSELSIEKMRLAQKGKIVSEETRRKIGEASKGNKYNLGKHPSEESRRKMSLFQKGRKKSSEHIAKIVASRKNGKGYKPSEESKMKNRMAHLGKAVSEETRRKTSNTMKGKVPKNIEIFKNSTKGKPKLWARGEKNQNWKGGITPINEKIRKSLEYKIWRRAVFERDNYTCIWCKARSGNGKQVYLEADHIKPFASFPELRFELSNGRTLCKPCHLKTPTWGYHKHDIKQLIMETN